MKSARTTRVKASSEFASPQSTTSKHFTRKRQTGSGEVNEDHTEGNDTAEGGKTPKRAAAKKVSPRQKKSNNSDEEYDDDVTPAAATAKKVYDSDALDEDSDDEPSSSRKRQRASPKKTLRSPRKKSKKVEQSDVEYDLEYEDGLKEGQEVVGVVVQAPKKGRVPPGQISQNTLDFLGQLKDPKSEKEWKDFIESFTDVLAEVDPQIPHLPPKDVIHRIYRDVRFSNDKTPYKKGLSASFSRSGRKGIFACLKPGNESIIAAGSWCPGRNELATIRINIQRNPNRLRNIISSHEFVNLFGKAKPHPKGERQNVFGQEDELKVSPKGIDKDHKCVYLEFTDDEVLAPDFKEKIAVVARVLQPFVHCLNDMMTLAAADDDDDDEGEGEDVDENEEP
ncbi:hypothetical protein B0H34DRAFT_723244 [Crassisporium funariophilum]|nr:hypothetical protein B0H34DRAFT_723244 [Crassisporium funariophilum]